jgi:hypothetical protein
MSKSKLTATAGGDKISSAADETFEFGANAEPSANGPAEANGIPASPAAPGPIDVAALRIDPDNLAPFMRRPKQLVVPVRKPNRTWFIRVHPDAGYHYATYLLELKDDAGKGTQEMYLVHQDLWPDLTGEPTFTPWVLHTAVSRQGDYFLWPIRAPRPDGRRDDWSATAREAAALAQKSWVRVLANMTLGAYDVLEASAKLPEPVWPSASFDELVNRAFRDTFIASEDHPVLKKLRGDL